MALARRKLLGYFLVSVGSLGLLIYGGDIWWLSTYGSSPQPVPSAILDVDRSFRNFPFGFPPDPGPEGKKTIPGVDADHDGVRDDVQRWIYAYVPQEPAKQMALRQMARYFQQFALAENYSPDMIRQSLEPLGRATDCLFKKFDMAHQTVPVDTFLQAKILNTFIRVKRYWNNTGKIRVMDVAGDMPIYEAPCEGR